MTLNELETELLDLNKQLERIFELTNYQQKHNLSFVDYEKDNPDDHMKFFEFESIFSHMDFINSLVKYLQRPISQTGIIEQTTTGEYKLKCQTLSVGDIVEILCSDEEEGLLYWHPRTIKFSSIDLIGKTARFRGKQPPHIH